MTWFKNRKMAVKLTLAFGMSVALTVLVGVIGLHGMSRINDESDEMYQMHTIGLGHIKDVNTFLVRHGQVLRDAIIAEDAQNIERARVVMREHRQSFTTSLSAFEKTIVDDAQRQRVTTGQRKFDELAAAQDAVWALAREGRDADARTALEATRALEIEIDELFDQVEARKVALLEQGAETIDETMASSRATMLTAIVACVTLACLVGFFLTQLITRPLHAAVGVLKAVSEADFQQKLDVQSTDEIGEMARAVNVAVDQMRVAVSDVRQVAQAMADGDMTVNVRTDLPGELGLMASALDEAIVKVRTALEGVRVASDTVASAATQLASASEEISSGAQEQASSLEETAASLEEMTATIRQNADNAQQASQLAGGARTAAEDGGQVVSDAVQAMSAINEASKKIADIITTIDEIAFQTNLLALNAAVEAARAGEQGRGFAVVATEVRNLAQRSATAAKEIKTLIQDSVHKVEAGSALVNASGQTLNEIVAAVKRVTDIVAEIAAASREQSSGIEQVNKAVTQMDQVTQANASQTEEMSGTAESLSAEAGTLQSLVARFKLSTEERGRQVVAHATRKPVTATPKVRKATPIHRAGTSAPLVDGALALDTEFQEF